jgi:hypothetical protein
LSEPLLKILSRSFILQAFFLKSFRISPKIPFFAWL